jgi:pilus assembly protein CpaD
MTITQKALTLSLLAATATLAGCAGVGGGTPADNPVRRAEVTRTVLEAHTPRPVAVEARLMVGASGTGALTPEERAQVASFAADFVRLGRGSLVISTPANSQNAQAAAMLAQEAQRTLFVNGVEFEKIAGGAYQAGGQPVAPVVLSFARYEVEPQRCTPWSQIDPRRTANNSATERFGCAQNQNLAAMIVDPGDLLGDRREPAKDAARIQTGVDLLRKGELKQVSGAVSGGSQ